MATNDPAHPPSVPFEPSTDAVPYPPVNTWAPPTPNVVSNTPYPPQTMENKNGNTENKAFPADAPPPYAPPTGGQSPYRNAGPPVQMPPPQPGIATYPSAHPVQYSAQPGTVTVTTVSSGQPVVVVPGTCPSCHVGMLTENFTILGICCAFWFFPFGLICCLAMKERRCTSCGAVFA